MLYFKVAFRCNPYLCREFLYGSVPINSMRNSACSLRRLWRRLISEKRHKSLVADKPVFEPLRHLV